MEVINEEWFRSRLIREEIISQWKLDGEKSNLELVVKALFSRGEFSYALGLLLKTLPLELTADLICYAADVMEELYYDVINQDGKRLFSNNPGRVKELRDLWAGKSWFIMIEELPEDLGRVDKETKVVEKGIELLSQFYQNQNENNGVYKSGYDKYKEGISTGPKLVS